ncbi:L,D-transpeptidase family protein [Streptomyces griseoviridis]|uniref:L,D-peptidoglycan transpeptidase YkuD (ErfK/YbiS/YcfS/YnhG family) n=2 Tax=Streptomyces griseoviridis TaxID=45398 RepID=A0ABT9LRA1_STRGD|nr:MULTISPECIES: L,D-transpeptidase family protein [Streptomyces]MDP9686064.1 L,D-peptidoglycan transpeptidase YkuD (ErfK/YbiS/YcfS/YnhG family) [Streptomyces griseoviridis]GGS46642.1 lipoprotein [Streptomyces niveoruber]GGS79132.1 lipoprotein [Streptomyces griseoviridis]
MTLRKALACALGAAVCAGLLGTGCTPEPRGTSSQGTPAPGAAPARTAARPLPGVGPALRARVPAAARQAVVVRGTTEDGNRARVVLYERGADHGWRAVAGPWPAHNGLRGWTRDHEAGDLRTPIGVFTLTDAGGRLPAPWAKLPYDEDPDFHAEGTGHFGESLEGSFDYVVAIDYNRVPGTTPLDNTRPLGEEKGGGVWLHVDHDGPTNACVSLSEEHMRVLLRELDPAKKPVVVMGPEAALAQ